MPGWDLLGATFFLVTASGLSITIGYHRYFSHRTFQASRLVQWVLLFFGTMATQGSVLRWSHDHRLHHRYVDKDGDPYDTDRGFWHSHLLWMFKASPEMTDRYLGDLKDDTLLVWQHRFYGLAMATTNIITVAAVGLITGDWFGAFVFAFLLRTFVAHHTTWFINSLAHMWGSKPYSTEHSAVNNFVLAFLTYGEGYHNYHHTFAGDYRNGIRWYQFDPSKYLIWIMSKVGLTWGLKRTDTIMIRRKLLQADLKMLKGHLERITHVDTAAFRDSVETMAKRLASKMSTVKSTADHVREIERQGSRKERQELVSRLRLLKAELSKDLKDWKRLCLQILDLEPAL
jgi:stearoyl-CoA desaturase (delta-9 desaturase)